jgi:hypothetical protein
MTKEKSCSAVLSSVLCSPPCIIFFGCTALVESLPPGYIYQKVMVLNRSEKPKKKKHWYLELCVVVITNLIHSIRPVRPCLPLLLQPSIPNRPIDPIQCFLGPFIHIHDVICVRARVVVVDKKYPHILKIRR